MLFAREIKIPVIGIIENMSGFICPHCHGEVDIFKKGGGERAAKELGVPFLGRIPFVSFQDKSKPAEAFMGIVEKVEEFAGRGRG